MRDGELVSDWRGGGSRSLEIRGWGLRTMNSDTGLGVLTGVNEPGY